MKEQCHKMSLKKKQDVRLSMLIVGGKQGCLHMMISFRCRQMSYVKLSCMDVFRSRLLYVVLKNKKQKYPDDDIELVHL